MGLLLHLIREQEMNIFDIDIAKITEQYLEYIKSMRQLDLEMAGDFVAMAATLLQIKSRMLLPQYNDEGEVVESEDPRKELVQRLLEYQKYQEASKQLGERPWVGRDLFLRGERLNLEEPKNDEMILEDNPLFSLISAYRTVVQSMKKGVHKVVSAMQSIAERILEIKEHLVVGKRIEFNDLIKPNEENRSSQILVTFLSLLELAKMGFISLFQVENYGAIHIDTKKTIDRDVVSQVENYDSVASEAVAEQILSSNLNEQVIAHTEELVDTAATDEEIAAEELRLEESPI